MRSARLSSVVLVALSMLCALGAWAQDTTVPAGNDPALTAAPPRPALGEASARAERLFAAIRDDEPSGAADFYLAREVFRRIKAVSDPDAMWARLFATYESDIHSLHASLGDLHDAQFVRLQFTGRRSWVVLREEGNLFPYWAQRHSWLVYRVRGAEQRFEVRTMIAWDGQWYITHLNEFR